MTQRNTLLAKTLAAAIVDPPSVDPTGEPLKMGPDGSVTHASRTHVDDRGSVTELFDTRWGWHPDPIDFVYTYTIREGWAKGWGLHQHHEDRYFLLEGRMMIVCYDVRPDSATCGEISKIVL